MLASISSCHINTMEVIKLFPVWSFFYQRSNTEIIFSKFHFLSSTIQFSLWSFLALENFDLLSNDESFYQRR